MDLSVLTGLTGLKHLYFNGSNNILTDLSFLESMTQLEELYFWGYFEELDLRL